MEGTTFLELCWLLGCILFLRYTGCYGDWFINMYDTCKHLLRSFSRWRCISTTSYIEGTELPKRTRRQLMLSRHQTWLPWLLWVWTFKVKKTIDRLGPGNATSWLSWLMWVWTAISTRALLRWTGNVSLWSLPATVGGISWECDLPSHLTNVDMDIHCHSMGLWVGLAGNVTLSLIWLLWVWVDIYGTRSLLGGKNVPLQVSL